VLDMNSLMGCLEALEKHMSSGDLECAFENAARDGKYRILDFLEKLMDLGDMADEIATKVLLKDSYLEMFAGVNAQK